MGIDVSAVVAHAVQQGALGDAGGGEDGVGPDDFVQGVLLVEIGDTETRGPGALVGVAEYQAPLELAADTLERRAGQHALGCAALADVKIDAGLRLGGVHHARDVAIGDKVHSRAQTAQRSDDVGMTRPVEDTDGDLGRLHALGPGDGRSVVGRRGVEINDPVGEAGAAGDLVHIGVGCVQ